VASSAAGSALLVDRFSKRVQPPASAAWATSARKPSPPWSAERLRLATEAAGVALWSWAVDPDEIMIDDHAFDLWGIARTDAVSVADLFSRIHPADRDSVSAAFLAARALPGTYEIDFRILVEGEVRWIACRGHGDDTGASDRTMFGVFLDATARKNAEEANELLAGEMSHRVKNLLAIAAGLTAITARSSTTTADMALQLTTRLTALGRAHELVRPVPGRSQGGAFLADLLSILLTPYGDMNGFGQRTRIAAPRIAIGEKTTTVLALVVHEMATNSLKYGAFSAPTGMLDVSCHTHEAHVVVVWSERGGPSIQRPIGPGGYGSRLVDRSICGQLGGSIDRDWSPDGLVATLRIRGDRLSA
jgi:two-component sensor histidine kinase